MWNVPVAIFANVTNGGRGHERLGNFPPAAIQLLLQKSPHFPSQTFVTEPHMEG